MRVLIVDGANVVGSRPDGWWRDRAAAASRLHDAIAAADLDHDLVVLVLEGQARLGPPVCGEGPLQTVHAPRSGDDTIVAEVGARCGDGQHDVVVVTADRGLRERVAEAGGSVVGPSWLLTRTAG